MISVTGISFSYDRLPVLHGVSFDVAAGEWLGILGPNGSGKTTLLKCLSRILKYHSGSVRLMDGDLYKYPQKDIARIVGVVPQDSPILYPFSAFEIVLMGRTPYQKVFGFDVKRDVEVAEEAMRLTDTYQFASRPIQELSGGERQRVIIARALAQEPRVLLLDEPTAFLDIKHQQDICNLLKKLNVEHGLTIISVMHDINLAALYCKSVLLMKKGGVFKNGPVLDVITYANLKEVFDTEVYVGINDMNGLPYYMPMVQR